MHAENAPSTTLLAGEHVAGRGFCDPAHTDVRPGNTARRFGMPSGARPAGAPRACCGSRTESASTSSQCPTGRRSCVPEPVALVGFFGQSRDEVDHSPIVAMERNIVARAARLSRAAGVPQCTAGRVSLGQHGPVLLARVRGRPCARPDAHSRRGERADPLRVAPAPSRLAGGRPARRGRRPARGNALPRLLPRTRPGALSACTLGEPRSDTCPREQEEDQPCPCRPPTSP